MKILSTASLVPLVLATAGPPARADDGAEAKLAVGGSLALWIPTSDADDYTDVSLGVRPTVIYWIRPFIGISGSFDFVFVNEETGVSDITYFSFSAGGRAQLPRGRVRPYGELMLGWYFVDSDAFDDNNVGLRFGGGASYALGPSLAASAGLAYSTTSIDTGFFDLTVAALIFDAGIAARF